MKDRMGVIVVFLCIFFAEAGVAYIWTNITIETTKQDVMDSIHVNLSNITVKSRYGQLMFKVEERNETLMKEIGPLVYIGLWNGTGRLEFDTIWKATLSNSTARDDQLLRNLTLGRNYTIWYIDYFDFVKNEKYVEPRTNVLVAVEEE